MKRLSLIIAVVILFVASSCAPSYMCPTYTNADQAPQVPSELAQNDL
jgi:capsular polysaccharide biosynthesis protein